MNILRRIRLILTLRKKCQPTDLGMENIINLRTNDDPDNDNPWLCAEVAPPQSDTVKSLAISTSYKTSVFLSLNFSKHKLYNYILDSCKDLWLLTIQFKLYSNTSIMKCRNREGRSYKYAQINTIHLLYQDHCQFEAIAREGWWLRVWKVWRKNVFLFWPYHHTEAQTFLGASSAQIQS